MIPYRQDPGRAQPMFGGGNMAQPTMQITPRSALTPQQLAYAREASNRPTPTGGPTQTLLPMAPGVTPTAQTMQVRSTFSPAAARNAALPQITPNAALTPDQLAYAREASNRPAPTVTGKERFQLPMAPGVMPQGQGGSNRIAEALFQRGFANSPQVGQPMFGGQITARSALSPEQLAYAREVSNRPAPTGGPTKTLLPMAPGVMPQADQSAMQSLPQQPQAAIPQRPAIGLTPEEMARNRTLAPGVRAINPYMLR